MPSENDPSGRLRAVLDTNVLISAFLNRKGIPYRLYRAARRRAFTLVLSESVLEELRRVWLEKFLIPRQNVEIRLNRLRARFELVAPLIRLSLVRRKDSDNRILEAAVAGRADYLVTGDKKDLLTLKQVEGIPIVSPMEFQRILNESIPRTRVKP
ncbi:MAG: putative toxin-antitoxin system toxin component, PIN family [Nitrospirae bacterium]|nr:putative toxin-antitoxin system toxin component, PIN family [Nitrospirota bacterium]